MQLVRIILFCFSICTIGLYSQSSSNSTASIDNFFLNIHYGKINETSSIIETIQDTVVKNQLKILQTLKKNNGYSPHSFENYIKNIPKDQNKNLYQLNDLLIAVIDQTIYQNNRFEAYNQCYKGYKLAKKSNNPILKREFLFQLFTIYKLGIVNNDKNINNYFKELHKLCKDDLQLDTKRIILQVYLNEMGILNGDSKQQIERRRAITQKYVDTLDSRAKQLPMQSIILSEYYHIKGLHAILNNPNKTLAYLEKEQEILNSKKGIYFNKYKYNNLKEIARCFGILGKNTVALQTLKTAKKYASPLNPVKNKFIQGLYASGIYYGLGQKDSAYQAMKAAFYNSLQLNFKTQNNIISAQEVANETQKKEQQLIVEQKKRLKNRNLFLGTLVLFIMGSVIGSLLLNNSKKKRKLAEQLKELEKQKNLTLLKEQELATINAMIEGQEKERKLIAEDLHDNIGSVLATLKLHFENLKLNREKQQFNQEELYEKTENLIDETYKKVRGLAHAKNAGVIANHGLLAAVQSMAEKISSANKTQIEVIPYGLNSRLDNSLEITSFRIIQELITNIIKHAQAKRATINLSHYEDELSIIIEDDGIGFDLNAIKLNDGIGLHSIKTRIAHLEGTIDIDSTQGKGTTIVISIPLEIHYN